MNIHEFQAKQVLKRFGVPVLEGKVATTPDEAAQAAKELGPVAVVKAQIHAGGRGKAGGVKVCKSPEEARTFAAGLLGKPLVTHQTGPTGRIVRRVWDHKDKKSGHDKYGVFKVRVTDLKHPITRGMTDFDTTDELYYRQQGEEPIEPLVVAKSKDTGKEEPLAWAYEYEKGRVFQTVLGRAHPSMRVR